MKKILTIVLTIMFCMIIFNIIIIAKISNKMNETKTLLTDVLQSEDVFIGVIILREKMIDFSFTQDRWMYVVYSEYEKKSHTYEGRFDDFKVGQKVIVLESIYDNVWGNPQIEIYAY